jgi:hypothetical protein
VRLVGYLESLTDKLLIDLVTVSAYRVGGSEVLVPQRVELDLARSDTQRSLERSAPGEFALEHLQANV